MENPISNYEVGRKLTSKSVQIRLMGHCIICLRKVNTKRIETGEYLRADELLEIAPKSVVSVPGFLATFNQVWAALQTKWKEKNACKTGVKGPPESTGISLENVLQNTNFVSANVSFSRAPTICQVCCDKVLAVENLMKAVSQQVREINILLEEGRRRQDGGGLGEFEKSLRENGLEESVIKATLQFVGIFDGISSQEDLQVSIGDGHVCSAPPPDMPCVISVAAGETVEENDSDEVDSDEDYEDMEGHIISGTEEDDDEDPNYLKEEPEEGDSYESTDDEDESEEEMEIDDEENDKNDPDFKVGKDPLAYSFPEKRSKEKLSKRSKWRNQHGSGSCKKKNTIEDADLSEFPCSCGKTYATFLKLRDHMRKNLKKHPEYEPFNFTKPNVVGSEDKEEETKDKFPCSCGKSFPSARRRAAHIRKDKALHPEYKPFMNVEGHRRPTCELCGEKVVFADLMQHYSQVHFNGQDEWVLRCPNEKCHFIGIHSRKLTLHLNNLQYKECKKIWKETTKGPVCEICGFKGTNKLKIRNHVRDKHENGDEKNFKCPISGCGKMFCAKQSVHFHLEEHRYQPTTQQICDKCGENLKVEEMEGHLKEEHGVNEVIGCKQCGIKFSGREEMVEHLFEHRSVGIHCDICGDNLEKFGKYTDFRDHYFGVHKLCPKKYKCGEGHCENWFWRRETRDDHELRMHKESNVSIRYRESLVKGRKKDFKCEECNVKFVKEDNLLGHNIKFHGANPFSCDICGETFDSKRIFSRHKREHVGIFRKEWKCEVEGCGKSFKDKWLWTRHKEVGHGGVKPYVCDICGKGYCDSSSLRDHHKIVHLGIKAWVCDECGESFGDSQVLKRHKMIHTGERPFGCEICGQRFRHKEVLATHVRGHKEKGDNFKPNGPMKQIRKRKAQ